MAGTELEDRIVALLDVMHQEIRSARFENLDAYSGALETILEDLRQLEPVSFARIRRLAQRNAACLEAAALGLRAARRRLAEIAAAGRSDTYDRCGMRSALPVEGAGRRL